VRALVDEALADTRVVLVNGARQSGKSTLVRLVGDAVGAEWYTFDDTDIRESAREDPREFVAGTAPMIIDEIQRLPEILLSIKARVDARPVPGQFLLTGSARVLGLRTLPDALPGRMETIELWPFAQGEIDGRPDRFIDAIFSHGPDLRHVSSLERTDYADRVVRGGFPEAVARDQPRRRQRFFDSYVSNLITRDVSQVGEIEKVGEMEKLVRLIAARSGGQLVINELAGKAGLANHTVARYVSLLQEIFLIKLIPAWSRNLSTRVTGTPKVAVTDSGIAANLVGADAAQFKRPGSSFGPLLEGFVLMELARQRSWNDTRVDLYHYRTRDQVEVDAVLENRRGQVVGIEVKASSTPRSDDFRGLRHLQDRLGDDFVAGVVLHTGQQTLPFGPKLRAMPVSALWELEP
jgi:predicted AAA+ superfamily ATPase